MSVLPAALAGTGPAGLAAGATGLTLDISAFASPAEPLAPAAPPATLRERLVRAREVLETVLDPEVPALSVVDLGLVRELAVDDGGALVVTLTPTYSGCPATEMIEQQVLAALQAASLGPARAVTRRSPAWSSDWISAEGRRKLREYGIAPPGPAAPDEARANGAVPIRIHRPARAVATLACPRCGSIQTEELSAFGSTACKSLHRCLSCREPFEHFKPI